MVTVMSDNGVRTSVVRRTNKVDAIALCRKLSEMSRRNGTHVHYYIA